MPTYWPSIPTDVHSWMLKQPLFFTASAPTHGRHINVSPKGYPCRSFAILSPNQVAYIDSTGSGIETIAHAYENGRVTVMFCSFTKFCRILRLFCKARVIERSSPEFKPFIEKMKAAGMKVEGPDPKLIEKLGDEDAEKFEANFDVENEGNGVLGARAVVVLDVWKVQHSCGYGVPVLVGNGAAEEDEYEEKNGSPNVQVASSGKRSEDPNNPHSTKFDETWDDRNTLNSFNVNQLKKAGVRGYRIKNNLSSLDDVPGLEMAMRDVGQNPRMVRLEHLVRRVFLQEQLTLFVGVLLGLFLALVTQRIAIKIG